METKRKIYISLFTVFGFLFGVFLVGFAQVVYIMLLFRDFVTYSFGLTWEELDQFGQVFSAVIVFVSTAWGYSAGKHWWKQIYVLKKYTPKYL